MITQGNLIFKVKYRYLQGTEKKVYVLDGNHYLVFNL